MLSEAQLIYAAQDADVLLQLREVMVKDIFKHDLAEIALIELSCVHAMALAEYSGITLDTKRWDNLLEHTELARGKALEALYTYTGKPVAQMNLWGGEVTGNHNFDSTPFILRLLKANGISTRSTSKLRMA
ncbi:MAG: hypothetical protein FWE91_11500 [Defluviitaleaceae bacterium]|nr:hypothetical protein [Defluviitaleaceae bacterium]MCL2836202.1 hypothetical protein [Defluviitaleaceae bacterium]